MRKFELGKTASHLIFYIGTRDWPNLSFGSLALHTNLRRIKPPCACLYRANLKFGKINLLSIGSNLPRKTRSVITSAAF